MARVEAGHARLSATVQGTEAYVRRARESHKRERNLVKLLDELE